MRSFGPTKMRPEDQLQIAVVNLLRHSGLLFTATANGAFLQGNAAQRAIRGRRMKDHGVSNGVPDLLIFSPPKAEGDEVDKHMAELRGYEPIGLAIELKAGKNKATPDQLQWIEGLRRCGWRAEVCTGIDEVLGLLRDCYPGKF